MAVSGKGFWILRGLFRRLNAFSDCQKYGANSTKPGATQKKIKTKSLNNEIINVKKIVGAEAIRTYNIQVIIFDNEGCSERKCPNAKMHLVLVKKCIPRKLKRKCACFVK